MFVNNNGTFIAGNPNFNNLIAVIGSRAATPYGVRIATDLGENLAKHYTVCSGLAFGIDAAAHRGALTTGRTIGFLSSTDIYPAAHKFLAQAMIEKDRSGLVAWNDGPPSREKFLQRNVKLAEACQAVVVVEASMRGGSMHCAKEFYNRGKPIFAVPGALTSLQSQGTNFLIKEGIARMVTEPSDITF